MNAERDIAGFALPFAVGILATTMPETISKVSSYTLGTISMTVATAAISYFLLRHRFSTILIVVSALSCGILTGVTHKLTDISQLSLTSGWTEEICRTLKTHIMGMNFNDMQTKGIMTALLTGDKSWLSEDTVTAFRSSGAAHILALSGFHLGIIYALISRTLSILGNSRSSKLIRSILIILLCGIYTSATGAGPSISRAFLFILIGEIALLSGRYRSTSTIMMSSMLIQLLFSPGSAQSIGFQLSYAAMAGIAYIFPWLDSLWPDKEKGIMKRIWTSASMSIACQITTGPLVFLYFGTFARHFLLTNLLILPLTCLIIPISLITLCLDLTGTCPEFMLTVTETLIGWMRQELLIIASI